MDQPYLPPPEADNAAPPSGKPRRTLALWVALIIMMIVIYQVVAPAAGHVTAPLPPCAEASHLGSSLATWGMSLLLIFIFIFFIRMQLRGGSKFNLLQEPGLVSLAEGQLERATAVFREVMVKYQRQSSYAAVARYNLATTLLRQGNLSGAVEEAARVEKGAGLLWASDIRVLAGILLAELYALRGQLDAAEKWLADARRRQLRSQSRTQPAAQLRLAETILQCRQGHFEDAVRLLDRDWRQLESTLTVAWMRNVWLMRAFAAAQLGGPRDAGAVPYLSILRTQPAGAYDHLAVEWPELRTFLVANSLSTAA